MKNRRIGVNKGSGSMYWLWCMYGALSPAHQHPGSYGKTERKSIKDPLLQRSRGFSLDVIFCQYFSGAFQNQLGDLLVFTHDGYI